MDIRHLRLFCRIVERRSFSLAATDLQITQPAASQQLRALEREMGVTLLDRSSRVIMPTDAGRVLYDHARRILDLEAQARTGIADLSELLAGEVLIGASSGPGGHVLPGLLTRFRARHPGVSLILRVDDTHTVIERVVARELEIGAVGAPSTRPELDCEPLAHDEVVLVCARGHAWAGRDNISLAELAAEPQIVQQHGAGLRAVVEDHLRSAGLFRDDLTIAMEMGLMESAKQATIAGGGVTFLSRWAIGPEVEHGLLHVVPVEGLVILRDFFMVRSRARILSRAAEALLESFRAERDASVADGPTPSDGGECSASQENAAHLD